jgi:hypothetical protein
MSRLFQFSLAGLSWFVLVAAVNLLTWRAVWQNLPRREMLGCDCIAITVPRDGTMFSDDDGRPKLPEPPIPDSFEWREPNWQPVRLTYLSDDGTVTVETVSPNRE